MATKLNLDIVLKDLRGLDLPAHTTQGQEADHTVQHFLLAGLHVHDKSTTQAEKLKVGKLQQKVQLGGVAEFSAEESVRLLDSAAAALPAFIFIQLHDMIEPETPK